MFHILTLVAPEATPGLTPIPIMEAFAARGAVVGEPDWLSPSRACDIPFSNLDPARAEDIARQMRPNLDVVVQPVEGRRRLLLLADMAAR